MFDYYQNIKPNKNKGGFSDIRMWPCYTMGCLATLAALPWIGFTLALLLAGVPMFLVMFKLAKIGQKASHVPQRWAVYEHIERRERAYDSSNRLLRRNMRIVQQDERQDRLLRRADRAMHGAKRA